MYYNIVSEFFSYKNNGILFSPSIFDVPTEIDYLGNLIKIKYFSESNKIKYYVFSDIKLGFSDSSDRLISIEFYDKINFNKILMIENLSKRRAKSLSYILYIIHNDNKIIDIKLLKDFIERYK